MSQYFFTFTTLLHARNDFRSMILCSLLLPAISVYGVKAHAVTETTWQNTFALLQKDMMKSAAYKKGNIEKIVLSLRNSKQESSLTNDERVILTLDISSIISEIKGKFTDEDIILIYRFLVKNHLWYLAEEISGIVKQQENAFLLDIIYYELAKFSSNQNDWDTTISHLTKIDANTALSQNEKDHATLLFGIALQQKKKHREAIKFYANISTSSPYYKHAQLNTAIGYIRQDWWTDAKIAIERAEKNTHFPELTDRMLVVLAYSQFNKEFYRDARSTFRKIKLKSIYADRALLGIGLSALSQKDYRGAINAFTRLKKLSNNNISSDESFLMLPYTYNKAQDYERAAEHYVEAIAHFETRITKMRQSLEHNTTSTSLPQKGCLAPNYEQKDAIVDIYRFLQAFEKNEQQVELHKQSRRLRNTLEDEVRFRCKKSTQSYIRFLESYSNQSNYGLAKLYDQKK